MHTTGYHRIHSGGLGKCSIAFATSLSASALSVNHMQAANHTVLPYLYSTFTFDSSSPDPPHSSPSLFKTPPPSDVSHQKHWSVTKQRGSSFHVLGALERCPRFSITFPKSYAQHFLHSPTLELIPLQKLLPFNIQPPITQPSPPASPKMAPVWTAERDQKLLLILIEQINVNGSVAATAAAAWKTKYGEFATSTNHHTSLLPRNGN